MADPIQLAPVRKPDDSQNPDFKAMQQKLARAKIDRARHQSRISDCYKYAMPWRHQFHQNQPQTSQQDQIFDSTAQRTLEDFAADMLNTFTPIKNNWIEFKPTGTLDIADRNRLKGPIAEYQFIIFEEMARSNLYQALQESYFDLGVGTMSLLINDIDPAKPIHCEAIPSTDKFITRGPFGFIDGEFREKKYLLDEAKVLWPNADWNKLLIGAASQSDQELEITDGCWRDWNDRANETYKYMVVCGSIILYFKEWIGAGSCPFITARWLRDSTTAWGFGPQYSTLPDIKTVNHVRYLSIKNYDKHVDPPTAYVDDGVTNIDNGVQPGDWIPIAPGSDMPTPIESKARFDYEAFQMDEIRSAIRRAHYQDRPEQLGKTPPTATQWADEAAERARRMGTPATNLVQELQYPIIRRFAYLLGQRGILPKLMLDGKEITLQPVSPLLRAQEQEEVVRMDRFVELVVARFGPQMGMIAVDVIPYVKRLAKLLGIDESMVRDEAKIKAAIEQLMPVLQATGFLPGSTPDVAVPPGLPAGGA